MRVSNPARFEYDWESIRPFPVIASMPGFDRGGSRMPNFRVTATSQPSAIRASQPPPPSFPGPLWFEAGVLWGMPPPWSTYSALPLAFLSVGAFRQCMQANLTGFAPITLGIGPGPYGGSLQMAQFSVGSGQSATTWACVATSFTSQGQVATTQTFQGWSPSEVNLIFPASYFQSVTANSPTGNMTIPLLPLILLSPNPWNWVAPYAHGPGFGQYFSNL